MGFTFRIPAKSTMTRSAALFCATLLTHTRKCFIAAWRQAAIGFSKPAKVSNVDQLSFAG
jgi:hypothetical protein